MGDKVIVVTRNGRGDVYLADSRQEADRHPLVQYGDVTLGDSGDIVLMWNPDELIKIARSMLDGPRLARVEDAAALPTWDERRRALQGMAGDLWQALEHRAEPLPDDPEVICNLVRRDREMMERTMADAKAAKTEKTPKPKPDPKPKTHGGFRPEQKITLLKDKANKPYGADNNPKRPGTSAAKMFILYKSGMSVAEFVAAGGTGAALKYDHQHGFIKVA